MTVQSKSTIKSYFITGAKPTQAQFEHLIDSYQDSSNILEQIANLASAGNTGLVNIQSTNSANNISPGSVGLDLIRSDTQGSALSTLGLSSGTTGFVKVTNNDTTDGRLSDKVSAHTGLTQTVVNPSSNEQLKIALDYATTAAAAALTDSTKPVNPVLLKAAMDGYVVTTAQANAGTQATGMMNPVLTKNAIETLAFTSADYATTAAAIAGTDATTIMNPVLTKNAITAGAGGAVILLSAVTANNSATIDFTSLITPTYRKYIFQVENLNSLASAAASAGNSTAAVLLYSSDNGSTWPTSAAAYVTTKIELNNSTVTVSASAQTGSGILLNNQIRNNPSSFEISLFTPQTVPTSSGGTVILQRSHLFFNGASHITTNFIINAVGHANGPPGYTQDIDAVRFQSSNLPFTSGVIRLYGVTA